MAYVLVIVGLVCLYAGAEMLVRGAVSAARTLGVSPLLIGLTVVGFGTSTPELMVSLDAALAGSAAIALGNVVGSNIANCLLVLGLAATLSPLACPRRAVLRDGTAMFLASVIVVGLVVSEASLGRTVGLSLLGLLAAYTAWSYHADLRGGDASALHEHEAGHVRGSSRGGLMDAALLGIGLLLLLGGAHALVLGATRIAQSLGVPEVVMGLTLVAVGTSLPEVAVSALATLRGRADVAIGNILGSNVFNLLGIIGVTAAVTTVPVPTRIATVDAWVMLGAAAVSLLMVFTGRRLGRFEGGLLLGGYAAYVASMIAGTASGQ